jgi:hypothetical protein
MFQTMELGLPLKMLGKAATAGLIITIQNRGQNSSMKTSSNSHILPQIRVRRKPDISFSL